MRKAGISTAFIVFEVARISICYTVAKVSKSEFKDRALKWRTI